MAQITPNELSEREFSKSIRGYNTVEVDEYINRIVENYAKLYRENIELSKRLAEAEASRATADAEEAMIRQTLQTAKKASDAIISEAYNRADDILASVKTSCDLILHNFRDKIAAQKAALADIQQTVHTFKSELFEKYRLHIELIEQISPVYEYEEELSPEEYVGHVVSDMKKEVAAQYGISLDTIPAPDAQTKPIEQTEDEAPTVELTKATDELQSVSAAAKGIASSEKGRKKRESIPSVMDILEESNDSDMKTVNENDLARTAQFKAATDDNAITAERPSFK